MAPPSLEVTTEYEAEDEDAAAHTNAPSRLAARPRNGTSFAVDAAAAASAVPETAEAPDANELAVKVRSMEEGSMAAALSSEDVLLLILSRVSDHITLLCCAGTCTLWFRLIASPPFRLCPAGNRPPSTFLLGIFSQQRSRVAASDNNRYFPPCFSRLATGTEMPTPSFFPDDEADGLSFNYAMPLASKRGLLLLRVDDGKHDSKQRLAVCNPLIGRRSARPIPPPPFFSGDPDLDVTGYALLTPMGLRRQEPAFQVLLTVLEYDDEDDPTMLLYAYSYSSWTGVWSRSAPLVVDRDLTPSGPRAAGIVIVSTAGTVTVHWLYRVRERFYTLDVSPENIHISLTEIPLWVVAVGMYISLPRPLLCHGADPGSLSLLITSMHDAELELWTRKDDSDWTRRGSIQARRQTKLVAFLESRRAMLVEDGHDLLALDLETMHMETVMTCSGRPRPWRSNASVLYQMDWPSYIRHLFLSTS